jgi:hypothetical protein
MTSPLSHAASHKRGRPTPQYLAGKNTIVDRSPTPTPPTRIVLSDTRRAALIPDGAIVTQEDRRISGLVSPHPLRWSFRLRAITRIISIKDQITIYTDIAFEFH